MMNSSVNEETRDGVMSSSEQSLETPFLDRYELERNEAPDKEASMTSSVWHQLETPFVSQLETETGEGENPQAELYAQLLAELHDEEFGEVISELVQEASGVYETQVVQEYGDSAAQREAAQEAVRDYLQPLVHLTDELLETIGQEMSQHNLGEMSEQQLDEVFELLEPKRNDLSPAFEGFLKGIWKKVKSAAKTVANVAKKGLKVAMTMATGGLNLILPKIKRLIMPLLRRVLQAAIGKLPESLRPAASQLATKLFGSAEMPETTTEMQEETTGAETQDIQREMDVRLLNSLVAESMEESEAALGEYQEIQETVGENDFDALQNARARFVGRITEMQQGEDAKPAMEEFIPAILPALKIGIGLIGRHRVVNFLAGLLAKLVGRFVGPDVARPLSRAIVDTGLKLIALELTEQSEERVAGNAIAATVEETIQQIATLPEYVLEDQELLEAHTLEAFEQAAAANFPAEVIKPELRESTVNGAWVLMPANGIRKFYKKFTVVFDKVLSPQTVSKITTFGGRSLMTVLRDQLNLDPAREYRARVHLYEAIPGTWLSRISAMEKNVRGLGSPSKAAWSQIHPLTREAASALLGEPGLGRDAAERFLKDRNFVGVGERFYFLEIEGVVSVQPFQRLRRSSRTYIKFDCPSNRINVALFLSERDAQAIASKLRQNLPLSTIMRNFLGLLQFMRKNFSVRRYVRVVHETVAAEEYRSILQAVGRGPMGAWGRMMSGARMPVGSAGSTGNRWASQVPAAHHSLICGRIISWSARKIADYLKDRKEEFLRATENPADGVTILITFANPNVLALVSRSLRGGVPVTGSALGSGGIPNATVSVYPGMHRV
jgi:hypothetical protein